MKKFILAISVMLALLMQACTFTSTTEKRPVFNIAADSVAAALNHLALCENFNVNGFEVTTNGQKQTIMEIDVINGKNIPVDDAAMNALAKKIALQVKEFLADRNAYSSYRVSFIQQKESNGFTKSESHNMVFTNEELTETPQAVKAI
jgi:hypothetical protein